MGGQQSIDEKFIQRLTEILEENLEKEHFGVRELAAAIGVSRSQLHRKLKAINGKSTSQFIREFRLDKAMDMLQDNVATASEIAYKVGFSSPTYFNTCFHQYFGYPPGEVKFRNPRDNDNIQTFLNNPEPTSTKSRKHQVYVIVIMVFFLLASLGWYKYIDSKKEDIKTRELPIDETDNSIAVLPFKNMSGSQENEAFCDGMTAAIISRLSKIRSINKVISLTSVMNYKENEKTITEIADELDVRYILESGFQKSGNSIKMNLQLIDGKSEQMFWSQEYKGTYDSIFKVQAQVAEMVAKKLDANVTKEEQEEIQKAMTQNMEAYESYLLGQFIMTNNSAKNFKASRKYFKKAIELDSTFAEAYERLGWTYSIMGTWFGNMNKRKADSLAAPYYRKALALDPDNLTLLRTRAEQEFYNWNFKVADSMLTKYRKEVGENFFSDFLNLMLGRYDKVIESENNRLKENPQNSGRSWPVVYAYYFKGEIDTTLYIMQKELFRSPNSEPNNDHFGNIYIALKDYEKAKDVLETALQISSKRYASMVIHLAIAYYYLDNEEKSMEYLNEVIERANNGEPEINVFVAHYYARLGSNDKAFYWLNRALKNHEVDLIWLKTDPNLLMLKDDPRYKVLCEKVGFPDCQYYFERKFDLKK
ncbi:helix-turn-helix domain-containing protein [Gramella sp. MT6]|uniref:helix-turn-helix domain-containing protein n=1 Tax=Gramella sp. MT6 TaxID=2705471 RepID=UPI001C5E3EFB|nr:helix-turn-helix domain-containing protein [Gramella sp. MT6]QYA26152.1 helix-turn-helix domain-containing protein [Gramella sp. MT6]